MKKSLYLIDISSFIFRAYYAIKPLSTKDGTPVNAVYGVVNMINRLIDKCQPDHVVVCNDRPDKGFRHKIFPEYKANRGAPPDDLIPQFDIIREFIKKYPILAIDQKGYEADDIIASLVQKYKKQKDMQIYIVSSDKDLMQLIDDNVFMYDTMKEQIYKEGDVVTKFGVGPNKVIDIQSLCGDAVDNIPGIAGVGPKTATKLITQYGDLESVLDHADELKGKLADKVKNGRESALLSRKLVTLVDDIKLDIKWDDLELSQPNFTNLNKFYKKLEFKKFIKGESEESTKSKKDKPKIKYHLIDTTAELKSLTQKITKNKIKHFAFDTETNSLNSIGCQMVGLSLCFDDKSAYYIPFGHHEGNNLKLEDIKKYLGPIFKDKKITKIAQNAKFDLNVLSNYDIELSPLIGDTMIASYLIDPTGKHNLDFLADRYMDYQTIKFSDVVSKGKTFADVPLEQAKEYAGEDAWVVFQLQKFLDKEVDEVQLKNVYHDVELKLVPILAAIEQAGILIDQKLLNKLQQEFEKRLEVLKKEIYKIANEEFNINSPKQLAVILFEKLKLPAIKKTKTGYSTDVSVLEELALQHELPQNLLEYRSLSKLLSTYVVQLKNLINTETGRIHTHFNQAIVATGRLSSTEPNLQNIPIKSEDGKRIRKAFICTKQSSLLSIDYSQIELRLLAAFSKDAKLVEAYQNDLDIHAKTASHILGLKINEVDQTSRNIGKTINFGVIYGQSPFGLAKQLGVPMAEAKKFIDGFYQEFHQVKSYKDEILELARTNGFVSTYLGRRRYLPDLKSQNKLVKQNAERAAFNTIFQGSAADLIKTAMIDVFHYLKRNQLKTKMILQVHDELIFEVPDQELDLIKVSLPEIMELVFDLDVPLKVSFGIGKNWAEAH
ncbi:DNA polymerase I [bacterium K02(2017)]|nr:DNA polymerase I [bacterium K02(2017)]